MLPDFGISSSLKYGRSVVWQATKIVRFLKYVRNLSLRWNRALFFRRGWAPSLLWIAYRTLCPEIVFHLNSEFFGMKISTWRVDGIRKTQEESLIFQRKNDLNLKGVISLKHIFSLKRQCFCEDSFVEGLLKQLFLSRKRFVFPKIIIGINWGLKKLPVVAGCFASFHNQFFRCEPVLSFHWLSFFVFSRSLQSNNAFIIWELKQLKVFWDFGQVVFLWERIFLQFDLSGMLYVAVIQLWYFWISSIKCFSPIKEIFLTFLVFWLGHRAVSSTIPSIVQCCFSIKQNVCFEKDQTFRNVSKTSFAKLFERKSSIEWRCFLAGTFFSHCRPLSEPEALQF